MSPVFLIVCLHAFLTAVLATLGVSGVAFLDKLGSHAAGCDSSLQAKFKLYTCGLLKPKWKTAA